MDILRIHCKVSKIRSLSQHFVAISPSTEPYTKMSLRFHRILFYLTAKQKQPDLSIGFRQNWIPLKVKWTESSRRYPIKSKHSAVNMSVQTYDNFFLAAACRNQLKISIRWIIHQNEADITTKCQFFMANWELSRPFTFYCTHGKIRMKPKQITLI